MWVGEVHVSFGFLRELGVSRHFLALVVGHRQPLLAFDSVQHACEPFERGVCGSILQLRENHELLGPLDERTDSSGVSSLFDDVVLPVPGDNPFVHLARAHVDGDHVGDLVAPVVIPRPGAQDTTGLAQQADNLGTKFTPRHRVDGRVDCLVTDVALGVVGILAPQYAADLLRGLPSARQDPHLRPQPGSGPHARGYAGMPCFRLRTLLSGNDTLTTRQSGASATAG